VPRTSLYFNLYVAARRYPAKTAIHYYGADLGYEMVLVEDACSSFDDAWHRAAVEFAITHLGEVATVDEIVAGLGGATVS